MSRLSINPGAGRLSLDFLMPPLKKILFVARSLLPLCIPPKRRSPS